MYYSIGHRLPKFIASSLFGDREKHGLQAITEDACWKEYSNSYMKYHSAAYKERNIGKKINNAAYKILEQVDLNSKNILEIGPGRITHFPYWKGKPEKYTIADIRQEILDIASQQLQEKEIDVDTKLLKDNIVLPLPSESVDIALSFFNLEHLYPLETYLAEIKRVLKKGGLLVGGIPTEGGLAWGMERFLTTRRYFKKETNIDYDKVICWEHPNFAEFVLEKLESQWEKKNVNFWPFKLPIIDTNLVINFIYKKI